jgi:hypothetical protein
MQARELKKERLKERSIFKIPNRTKTINKNNALALVVGRKGRGIVLHLSQAQ